jgi:hypothetical protein
LKGANYAHTKKILADAKQQSARYSYCKRTVAKLFKLSAKQTFEAKLTITHRTRCKDTWQVVASDLGVKPKKHKSDAFSE